MGLFDLEAGKEEIQRKTTLPLTYYTFLLVPGLALLDSVCFCLTCSDTGWMSLRHRPLFDRFDWTDDEHFRATMQLAVPGQKHTTVEDSGSDC